MYHRTRPTAPPTVPLHSALTVVPTALCSTCSCFLPQLDLAAPTAAWVAHTARVAGAGVDATPSTSQRNATPSTPSTSSRQQAAGSSCSGQLGHAQAGEQGDVYSIFRGLACLSCSGALSAALAHSAALARAGQGRQQVVPGGSRFTNQARCLLLRGDCSGQGARCQAPGEDTAVG
jgi:hypothetical protein